MDSRAGLHNAHPELYKEGCLDRTEAIDVASQGIRGETADGRRERGKPAQEANASPSGPKWSLNYLNST